LNLKVFNMVVLHALALQRDLGKVWSCGFSHRATIVKLLCVGVPLLFVSRGGVGGERWKCSEK